MAMKVKKAADVIPIRKGVSLGVEKATQEARSLQGVIRPDFIQVNESDPLDLSVTTEGDLALIALLAQGENPVEMDDEARYNAWLEMHAPLGGAKIRHRVAKDGRVITTNSSVWSIRPASNSPEAFRAAVEDTKRRYADRIQKAEYRKLMQQSASAGYGPYKGFKYSFHEVRVRLDELDNGHPRRPPIDLCVRLLEEFREYMAKPGPHQLVAQTSTKRQFVNEGDAQLAFPALRRKQAGVANTSQPVSPVPQPQFSDEEIQKGVKAGTEFMSIKDKIDYQVAQDELLYSDDRFESGEYAIDAIASLDRGRFPAEAANDVSAPRDYPCIVTQLDDMELKIPYALSDWRGYMHVFGWMDSKSITDDEMRHDIDTVASAHNEIPNLGESLDKGLEVSVSGHEQLSPAHTPNQGTPPSDLEDGSWVDILYSERVISDHAKAQMTALEVDEVNRYVLQAWNMSQRLPPPRLDETVEEYVDVIDKWLGDKPSPVKMAKAFVPLSYMPRVTDELLSYTAGPSRATNYGVPFGKPSWGKLKTTSKAPSIVTSKRRTARNIEDELFLDLFNEALSDLAKIDPSYMGPPEPIYLDGNEIVWNGQPRGIILLNSTAELNEKGKVSRLWWPGRDRNLDTEDSQGNLVRRAHAWAMRKMKQLKSPPKTEVHVVNKIILPSGDEIFVPTYGGKPS